MSKTATVHAQQKWEYMELSRKTEGYLINDLNELGQVGWEMVSVSFHKGAKSGLGESWVWTAFLKRPHSPHPPSTPTSEKAGEAPQPSEGPEEDPKPAHEPAKAESDESPEIFDFKS